MIARGADITSLHPSRLDIKRLGWAFALSLALHLIVWGGYEGGKKLGVWDKLHLPAWITAIKQSLAKTEKKNPATLMSESEPPLMFVEVNPLQSTTEAPKNAKYYSDKNSQAANPDADADTDTPKISGAQTEVTKTENTDRNKFDKLQPSRPKQPAEQEAKLSPAMGDLALAKPDPNSRQDKNEAEKQRPRTVQEAKSRQQLNRIPGQQMKQEGGVKRRLDFASLDAKATPFGAYDAAFIEAVTQRWYDLLDSRDFSQDRRGHVVLRFDLNYDGRITDVKVVESTVGEMLGIICRKAVEDPAPFERWPSDMRRMIGKDYREIQFTFYYN
jgi:hypothetical protein